MIEARELPMTGYALEVDGRMKTEFKSGAGFRGRRIVLRRPLLVAGIVGVLIATSGWMAATGTVTISPSSMNFVAVSPFNAARLPAKARVPADRVDRQSSLERSVSTAAAQPPRSRGRL